MYKSLKLKVVRKKRGVLFISKHADEHKMDRIPHYLYRENKKSGSNPTDLYLI